jgi:iron complex outermembrane receptor protein
MRKSTQKHAVRTLPLLIAAAYAGGALAQSQIEEVVITAQKRQEKLQDVPLSVTAISGAQLETRGIEGVANLNALAPNLMYRSNPGADLITTVALRGSGAGQPAIWFDPPTGMYVDGVYVGKAQGAVFDVVELERVEVLRGPQGTLFGRNTEGGAVNLVSRRPTGVWGGSIGAEIGNYGHRVGRVALDLPQMGIAKISVGARKEDRDGWAKNANGQELAARDKEAWRLAATLDFTKDLKLDYTYDKSENNNTPTVTSLESLCGWSSCIRTAFGAFLGGAMDAAMRPYITTSRPSNVNINTPFGFWEKSEVEGHSVQLAYKLNDSNTFKYIFAKREVMYSDFNDIDGTPVNSITPAPGFTWGMNAYYGRKTDYEMESHEIQWLGNTDRLKWVLGYYHYEDDGTTLGPQMFDMFGPRAGFTTRSDYSVSSNAKALFGQMDIRLTDKLTATVGMRRTEEEKSGWTHRFVTNGFNGPQVANIFGRVDYRGKFSGNTPMAALAYKLDNTTNIYGRVAKGFKSGGFSAELTSNAVLTPFQPQTSWSGELGIKKTFLNNKAQINAAVFQNKISDQQVTQLVPGTTESYLTNAGKSTYRGFELEGALVPVDGWKIQASYGYLKAEFDKYIDNALNITGRPLIDTASNREAGYAPKHTFSLNVDGRLAKTSWGTLRAIADYTYTAEMNLYACNKDLRAANAGGSYGCDGVRLPDTQLLNLRLLLAGVPIGGPGAADISLWVKNATNEDKKIQGIDFGVLKTANWQEPRMYGVTFNYKW